MISLRHGVELGIGLLAYTKAIAQATINSDRANYDAEIDDAPDFDLEEFLK